MDMNGVFLTYISYRRIYNKHLKSKDEKQRNQNSLGKSLGYHEVAQSTCCLLLAVERLQCAPRAKALANTNKHSRNVGGNVHHGE